MIADEIRWENRHEFDAGSRVAIAKMYAALVRARKARMQVKRLFERADPPTRMSLAEFITMRRRASY